MGLCSHSTCDHLFGTLLGEDFKVLQGDHHSLYTSKHSGEAKTEEHDEKQYRPKRRKRHLSDSFCEHNEGEARSLHSLEDISPVTLTGWMDGFTGKQVINHQHTSLRNVCRLQELRPKP